MIALYQGDCHDVLPTIPDASVDAIITDPPYPCIKRSYGCLTEAEWWSLMMDVCREARRILKPTGSAVFVLQPNSRKLGSMRGWLFRFQAWACDEWNMIEDVYWWNTTALPKSGQDRKKTLPRPSVKPCVWLGDPGCYRDIDSVLKDVSDSVRKARPGAIKVGSPPSGWRGDVKPRYVNRPAMYAGAIERGGSTPFNVLPIANSDGYTSAGAHGHGAGTPEPLMDWWTRYLVPPDGIVCDPFMGSGTQGIVCVKRGLGFIGIEAMPEYFAMAERRIHAERDKTPLLT